MNKSLLISKPLNQEQTIKQGRLELQSFPAYRLELQRFSSVSLSGFVIKKNNSHIKNPLLPKVPLCVMGAGLHYPRMSVINNEQPLTNKMNKLYTGVVVLIHIETIQNNLVILALPCLSCRCWTPPVKYVALVGTAS